MVRVASFSFGGLLVTTFVAACGGSAFSAASDASAGDAVSPEGGADGAGATGWCATHAPPGAYCEDFDGYPDATTFLQSTSGYSLQGGTLSFPSPSLPATPSAPNALSARTTAPSQVNSIAVVKMPSVASQPRSRRVEFDLYIGQASGIQIGAVLGFAAVLLANDVSAGAVALGFGPGDGTSSASLEALYIEPADAGPNYFGSATASGALPNLGSWDGRVALEIDYQTDGEGARTACVQLFVGAKPQLDPCKLTLPPYLASASQVYLGLGVFSGGLGTSTGTVDVAFDDVVYVEQ